MNDKMIAKLEAKGFNRWTKGNMDRLYINAQAMGLEVDYYKTGNVSDAKWNGERISHAEARRMLNAKTYIDLKDDTLHSDHYWCDTLKEAAQAIIDEVAAEIEAEEKAEAETAQTVEETAEVEAENKNQEEKMENKKWYAVMVDRQDTDWGTGSFDEAEAEKMVVKNLDIYPDGYIAVIENDTCVGEIAQEDFDPVYANACEIIKSKDWDACKDALDSLMHWLGMGDEWKDADADNFEDVIRKAGELIGVDLV